MNTDLNYMVEKCCLFNECIYEQPKHDIEDLTLIFSA